MELVEPNCPRCGKSDCHDPDSKACSDNCIERHQATEAALRAELKKLRDKVLAFLQMLKEG
jgi:hypothetical protein